MLFRSARCAQSGSIEHYIYLFMGRSSSHVNYYYFFNKFILLNYLFLAELDLRCCIWAFSSCGERGLLSIALHRLLPAVASLVAEHGL